MMLVLLLVLFQLKHFLCDYIFQNRYMLGKFNGGWSWITPLAVHCLVHAVGTYFIALFFIDTFVYAVEKSLQLALFDFGMHFVMDRIKASPNLLGRWKPDHHYYWWTLGLDQMIHHLTHYAIVFGIIYFGAVGV